MKRKTLKQRICEHKYIQHETKRHVLKKFIILVSIVVLYFIFVSIKFGITNGFWITLLTWSFFVFCTPVADAGFLLDFPIRILTGIRMLHAEIGVWVFAGLLNAFTLTVNPSIYQKTIILQLFHYIITHPFPYWLIIVLSCIGTFLSIYFGDELMDVAKHKYREKYFKYKAKHEFIILLFLIVLIIVLYKFLLTQLGINIAEWF